MKYDEKVIGSTERLIFALRSLYGKYGYSQYRMSKFEEYALYGRNIDFLVSDSVITFTDTDGKLMALKPDVTLSIVKNDRDDEGVRKVCYDENVYRVSKGTGSFKEIMQTGLECIGDVDACLAGEVLMLAAKSLDITGKRFVLEVSHLGLLAEALGAISDDPSVRAKIVKCVGERSIHSINEVCRENGIRAENASPLLSLLSLHGSVGEVIEKLNSLPLGQCGTDAVSELEKILAVFEGTSFEPSVKIDFSVTSDENYYNGIVFKGFVEGVPQSVLSGGQYDKLMKKMGRHSRAIGFAVYLDMLERISDEAREYDFDVMLIYGDGTTPAELQAAARKIIESGRTVFCCKRRDGRVRCRDTVEL